MRHAWGEVEGEGELSAPHPMKGYDTGKCVLLPGYSCS